ncbi:hypothetical protein BZA05DRAFT_404642 [Tricharina praecox]|uniref:uncharacterized protein n=1 Tax=Tricharina praecox TaxID=43433 RepID=UPI0022202ED5|nr:uncharacterized protein BZA05DRAFT_404642 [Tricharina praecox]KAI5848171.1 hypothetical protein BZA05DRAFT_404642 [Tricharina praecox]
MAATTSSPASTAGAAKPADANVIQARIDLQVSKARNLVASWLPARQSATAVADNDDEDDELFKPAPPSLGVGAPIPAEFKVRGAGTDTLRRNLLGGRKPTKQMPAAEKLAARKRVEKDDSDEDTGRSALGGVGSKKRKMSSDLRRKPAKVSALVAVKTGEKKAKAKKEDEGSKTKEEGEAKVKEEDKPEPMDVDDTPTAAAAAAGDTPSTTVDASKRKSKSKKKNKKNKQGASGAIAKA